MTTQSRADAPGVSTRPPASTESDKLPKGAPLVIGLLVSAAFVVILNETIMSV
jgi:hypothetical protein